MSQWAENENQLVCLCVPNTSSHDNDHSDVGVDRDGDGDGDGGMDGDRSRENCCFVFVKHHTAPLHGDISKNNETDENHNSPQGGSEGEKDLFSTGERKVLVAAVKIACRSSSSSHSQNTHRPGILDQGQESFFVLFLRLCSSLFFIRMRLFYPPLSMYLSSFS